MKKKQPNCTYNWNADFVGKIKCFCEEKNQKSTSKDNFWYVIVTINTNCSFVYIGLHFFFSIYAYH